jgi:hypothetical protein
MKQINGFFGHVAEEDLKEVLDIWAERHVAAIPRFA